MRWKVTGTIAGIIVLLVAAGILVGTVRWQSDTRRLHARLAAARLPVTPAVYGTTEREGLPEPVQRYFRTVLKEGQPLIAAVHVEHTGTFNMSETGEQWRPFTSTQYVVTRRPGFVWDARIRMAPGMNVHVHDAYVAGKGHLRAKLFGLVTVMSLPGSPELDHGELMRFLAEAAWYPTALLPSQGVVWEAMGERQARATLADGRTTVSLVFQFDEDGLLRSVRSDGRYRSVDGQQVPTPWEGRFWNYQERDGMLIPQDGEVAWLLQDGRMPYWRGHMERIEYEYAQGSRR